MPSGAKKRKAAKKKKEKEAHITSSTNNPLGYDDVKSQDEKGSDSGEVNSPSNQDNHNHHHLFGEEKEELRQKDSSSVPSVDVEEKSLKTVSSGIMKDLQKVGLQGDDLIKIEKDVKSEEPSENKNINIEYNESAKEPHYGGGRNSSSSSSDDEFQEFKKKPSNKASNLVSDATSHNDWVNSFDSSSAHVVHINGNGAPNGKNTDVYPIVPALVETVSVTENAPIENSVVSDVIESGSKNGVAKSSTSRATVLSSTKTENKVVSLTDVIESGSKNGVAKSSTSRATVLSSTKTENKVVSLTDENAKASSTLLELRTKESEIEPLSISGALVGQALNDAERSKEFEIPESSENQPPVSLTPQVIHRTSWFSCCGILDVLTGSSR